jgi:hypothetical protein
MNIAILALYAVAGSFLAELVSVYYRLHRGKKLPACYSQRFFYLVRVGIALGAGLLPSVFAVDTATAAFALGVGAPIVINQVYDAINRGDNHGTGA